LPDLRDMELERIAREYDRSTPWTENDEYEKRTICRDANKSQISSTSVLSASNRPDLLSTQIAHRQKQHVSSSNQHIDQHSTPSSAQMPMFNDKLSPIDKIKSTTRIHTQVLLPINENTNIDEQVQVKRRKVDDTPSTCCSDSTVDRTHDVHLSTIDDIQDDDLIF
jgi:hypothetical protein